MNNHNDFNADRRASEISSSINMLNLKLAQLADEDKIYQIKLEIAKTTDPRVRQQLQILLADIEGEIAEKKRFSTWLGVIILVVLLAAGFIIFRYYLGGASASADPPAREPVLAGTMSSSTIAVVQNTDETSETVTSLTADTAVDVANLTEEQFANWIMRYKVFLYPEYDTEHFNDNKKNSIHFSIDENGYAKGAFYTLNQTGTHLILDGVYIVKDDGKMYYQQQGLPEYVAATGWQEFVRPPY